MGYLLDTNIITAHLKNNQKITNKLEELRLQGRKVFISGISYYEIKRGLLAVNATSKLSAFNNLCRRYRILLLDDIEIIERAAEIHADLKRRGKPIQDTDILIAATALRHSLILVSNDSDLLRVRGITVENWLRAEG